MNYLDATVNETPLNTLLNRLSDPSREISNMSTSALNSQKRPHITKPSTLDSIITSSDLEEAAKCMRRNNVTLISKSLRTHLYCFDNIDIQKFEPSTDFIVNFISKGSNSCSGTILRPVSILWPSKYDDLAEQLAILDAFLLNSDFRDYPVEWLIRRGLIPNPVCHQCKAKMTLFNEAGKILWVCEATQACSNYSMPVLRPTLFASFEHVGLDKLLYSIYYWATCTPAEELYEQMDLDLEDLNGIWGKLQNICRATLEKAYPRHRLTNNLDPQGEINLPSSPTVPIDLVSIKLNQHYIICAKHPDSNLVRLGILTPRISNYSFSDLTQTWFAHGSHIRVSEGKFLDLREKRTDMKIDQVSRMDMISKNGCFDRSGAFGYMITQLAHLFKDQDSASVNSEQLKMLLAEMQWRELYGDKPFESFVNIIAHMTQYGNSSLYYSEPDLGVERPLRNHNQESTDNSENSSVYVWAESYYYAEFVPKKYLVNGNGKSNRNNNQVSNQQPIAPDVKLTCHHCNQTFNNFEFCMHLIGHLERSRLIDQRPVSPNNRTEIECKHCFKTFDHEQVAVHSALFRTNYMLIQYSCRICCIHLKSRTKFIEHMRQTHFQHETPYHCPFCDYAASIQRDVLIHFHEKHRQQMVLLCPLCFREFTVAKPESMNRERMRDLSKIIYDHLLKHYSVSRSLTCSSCCLCFAEPKQLAVHRKLHHNPLQVRQDHLGSIKPYIVDDDDKKFCVKALRIELFIANKEPNANLLGCSNCSSPSSSGSSATSSDSEEKEKAKSQLLVVRGINGADKLLDSGGPTLKVGRFHTSSLTSQKLIELFSNSALKRADGLVATQSVVLTPAGRPVKCGECLEYITEDHFVSLIICKPCQYSTHCPLAATRHLALEIHIKPTPPNESCVSDTTPLRST